jgi:hypothetical protein
MKNGIAIRGKEFTAEVIICGTTFRGTPVVRMKSMVTKRPMA